MTSFGRFDRVPLVEQVEVDLGEARAFGREAQLEAVVGLPVLGAPGVLGADRRPDVDRHVAIGRAGRAGRYGRAVVRRGHLAGQIVPRPATPAAVHQPGIEVLVGALVVAILAQGQGRVGHERRGRARREERHRREVHVRAQPAPGGVGRADRVLAHAQRRRARRIRLRQGLAGVRLAVVGRAALDRAARAAHCDARSRDRG